MADIHGILFNAQILFSVALGIWAAIIAGRNEAISGNYWGAIATFAGLVAVTLVVGILLTAQGLRPRDGRLWLYYLYMLFLLVILPGLFSLLRGRDDRTAAISFAVLTFFNASMSVSLLDRGVVGPWVEPA
jgi:putative exporter of polyketide antibiotics